MRVENNSSEDENEYNDQNDIDFKCKVDRKEKREKRKKEKEAENRIGETGDRFKLSNDAVSHLTNAIRAADNILTEKDKEKVVTWKKVERVRKRSREQKSNIYKGFQARGLMVDERVNENKVEVGLGEKGHKRFSLVKKEDCAVIGYPGEVFLGHMATVGGKGIELANSLDDFVKVREIDISGLQVVFADGCNKMGGYNHGFIAEFERIIGHPLLHIHCIYHSLEKIFGHVFTYYAGATTGPSSWSGEEAKKLTGSVWELAVVEYEAVPSPSLRSLLNAIPANVWEQFNNDTRYLLEMAKAVESGHLEKRWANSRAGLMTNARWQNTESRVLRVYMSTLS